MSNFSIVGEIVFADGDGNTVRVDASELERVDYKDNFVELNLCGPVHKVLGRYRWNDEHRGAIVYVVQYESGHVGTQVANGSQKNESATSNIRISEVQQ